MDPQPLTPSEWGQLGISLRFMWVALGAAFFAGPVLLTAHAIIPSLVDTETINPRWSKARPVFYVLGLLAVAAIIACLVLAVINMGWLETRYSRYWQ